MDNLFFDYSIGELVEKQRGKKIAPAEIYSAALTNIKELDKIYFPFVMYGDGAFTKKEYTKPGLLENIPIGVKDIFNTADFPTQMGSPLWKDFTPGNDARAIYNLKRQGAVVIGKTVTAEFAVHEPGKTLNPYDITKNTGTSSSGSAVAVTLGMVPLATGTQTAGSIVRPASFCGVYGCKPSFGTIPRTGMLKTTDTLDSVGFLLTHQKDLCRVFDSMRITGPNYPVSHAALSDPSRQTKGKGKPWRVGFARTHTWKCAPQYAQSALEKFINTLAHQKDIEVMEAKLPSSMNNTHDIHTIIYNKALSYYFSIEYRHADYISPIMNTLITEGKKISVPEYQKAMAHQTSLIGDMDDFFKDFDILISLSTAGEAPLREVTELPDPALMWTLTHLPVVSVPQFTSPNGLPFGMQIVARKYNDYLLFEFLNELESRFLIPEAKGFIIDSLNITKKPKSSQVVCHV